MFVFALDHVQIVPIHQDVANLPHRYRPHILELSELSDQMSSNVIRISELNSLFKLEL